jgi:hypothetical protein
MVLHKLVQRRNVGPLLNMGLCDYRNLRRSRSHPDVIVWHNSLAGTQCVSSMMTDSSRGHEYESNAVILRVRIMAEGGNPSTGSEA